jgi:hypothetical protein
LFGKSGLELTEFLNQGADGLDEFARKAEDLGIIIDTKTAAAADEFNDTLGDLKALASGFGLSVASDLLPNLVQAAKDFRDLVKEGDLARNLVDVISAALSFGVGVMREYTSAVAHLSVQFEFLANSA